MTRFRKAAFIFIGLLSLHSQGAILSSAQIHCKDKAEAILKQWQSMDDWRKRLTSDEGTLEVLASPTSKTGNWVYVKILRNGDLELLKRTPSETLITRIYGLECVSSFSISNHEDAESAGPAAIEDLRLEKILQSNRTGVIFAWSPEMPLSIPALKFMQEAAKRRKIDFIPVLDPVSKMETAEKLAKKEQLPPEALAKLDSLELVEREMNLHYPSYIVFKNGKLSKSSVRGYLETEGYLNYLKTELGE